jgi:uncharacterized protein YecE (DUF72 family)
MSLYLGCPIWGAKAWVGNFFPAGTKQRDFLAVYSRRLNTVEGNTTFYATPNIEIIERWRDETRPGFKFCFKFPQVISHRKRLQNCEAETAEFVDRLRRLGDRRGPSFLQLPPSFGGKQLPLLEAYLAAWPRDLECAVEPRHADFFGKDEAAFDALLRRYHAARCVFDTSALASYPQSDQNAIREAREQKPKFPVRTTRTASFAFVRYLCHPDVDANRAWLSEWAARTSDWLKAGDDAYFFFHYPGNIFGPVVARLLHSLVAARYP